MVLKLEQPMKQRMKKSQKSMDLFLKLVSLLKCASKPIWNLKIGIRGSHPICLAEPASIKNDFFDVYNRVLRRSFLRKAGVFLSPNLF